jgi:GNAT superfamily N-acetyltransferase
MNTSFQIIPLTQTKFTSAVSVVMRAGLDTQEEIEHHLRHLDEYYIAVVDNKVIGVIGWYQDNVHYADKAMGNKFPGEEAYWVGFFAVDKDYQNRGIGTALLQKLEHVVKERQVKTIWVSSVPETKSYYEHNGFELVLEGYIGGKQKFFLSKQLT